MTRSRAFTLIEVLVVVAIVGVLLATAAVNLWPSDEEVARREAGLIALSLEKARDAAWFGGQPTAVSFGEGRLRQWQLDGERLWRYPAANDRPLGDVAVTALHVDGLALAPGDRLIFMADGFSLPFRVQLEIRGLVRAIEGDAAGSVTVTPR